MNRCIKVGLTAVYTSIFLLLAGTGALQSHAEPAAAQVEYVEVEQR